MMIQVHSRRSSLGRVNDARVKVNLNLRIASGYIVLITVSGMPVMIMIIMMMLRTIVRRRARVGD